MSQLPDRIMCLDERAAAEASRLLQTCDDLMADLLPLLHLSEWPPPSDRGGLDTQIADLMAAVDLVRARALAKLASSYVWTTEDTPH